MAHCVGMLVFLNGVAYVEWLARVDVAEIFGCVESNAVDYLARCVIDKFEFYMFQLFAYQLACTEVHHFAGAEHRFHVAWPERVE